MTQPPNPSRPAMTEAEREAMLALADACEKATGPDRELDISIAEQLGLVPIEYERAVQHGNAKSYFWHAKDSHAPFWFPERYTASLDAAITLVPEGTSPAIGRHRGKPNGSASVTRNRDGHYLGICHDAATPALALTAAAIRARANQGTPA